MKGKNILNVKSVQNATASGVLRQTLNTGQYWLLCTGNSKLLYWQILGFFSQLPNPSSASGETIQNSLNY